MLVRRKVETKHGEVEERTILAVIIRWRIVLTSNDVKKKGSLVVCVWMDLLVGLTLIGSTAVLLTISMQAHGLSRTNESVVMTT